ncbi:hypothetical protein Tco_1069189 [Tanacetum coccineum]|uniref:Uncharacterized protein n=1 Tax=Tanacetum coccineum TaxID=301880 RepID=A0ABQ5HJQ1_9ASTR
MSLALASFLDRDLDGRLWTAPNCMSLAFAHQFKGKVQSGAIKIGAYSIRFNFLLECIKGIDYIFREENGSLFQAIEEQRCPGGLIVESTSDELDHLLEQETNQLLPLKESHLSEQDLVQIECEGFLATTKGNIARHNHSAKHDWFLRKQRLRENYKGRDKHHFAVVYLLKSSFGQMAVRIAGFDLVLTCFSTLHHCGDIFSSKSVLTHRVSVGACCSLYELRLMSYWLIDGGRKSWTLVEIVLSVFD